MKLAKEYNRRCFLLKCRKEGVLPKHITTAVRSLDNLIQQQNHENERLTRWNNRLGNKLINNSISSNHSLISQLENNLKHLKSKIISSTDSSIFSNFSRKKEVAYNRLFHKIKRKNIEKLNKLLDLQSLKLKSKDNWLKNLTNVEIPHEIKAFLSLGPKFSIEPILGKDISLSSMLSDIDYITSFTNDSNLRNCLISRSTNVITNYFNHSRDKNYHFSSNFFQKLLQKSKRFLKQNPNIILTKSDKGNVTVLMYKEDYVKLTLDLIDNDSSYVKLNRDPTNTIQTKCNSLVKSLFDNGLIDETLKKKLTCYNGTAPKFYTLPKIHKPILSVRPIVASISSPTNHLSAFITNILTSAYDRENTYHIKDSFEVNDKFNRTYIPTDYIIASLDVVSLFSNVYLEIVLEVLNKKWSSIANFCSLPKDTFINLITFLFNNTFFNFDNKFYKQTFGTPMGAKISPILADYVMDDLLDRIIPTLPFNLHFIKKYVDDIIISFPANKVDCILEIFNSFDPHIKFTLELEDSNHSIPFLDTRMIRTESNMLLIDWYRKPVSSGRYLNYWSYHKTKMKINLVKQMKVRVLKISDHTFLNKNLKILYGLFIDNGYPPRLLNNIIFHWSPTFLTDINENSNHNYNLNPFSNTNVAQPTNSEVGNVTPPTIYVTLPFIWDITMKLSRIFSQIPNIRLANKTVLTLNSVHSKLKCKDEVTSLSNVVYKLSCTDCNKVYIGQTGQTLKKRLSLHKSDARLHPDRCALADHIHSLNHIIDFNTVEVLAKQSNTTKRLFLEMSYIFKEPNSINKKTDIKHLSEIYSYLLSMDSIGISPNR